MGEAILFLDMDGVLCTARSHIAQPKATPPPRPDWPFVFALDREGIGLLNALAENTRLRGDALLFVCSSTWRLTLSREQLADHLRRYGWQGTFHEDWATPQVGNRGQDISAWLARHPEIDTYAILDDDHEAGAPHLAERFVQVRPEDGLTYAAFAKLHRILCGAREPMVAA